MASTNKNSSVTELNRLRGSRKLKGKFYRTHCKYCGKKLLGSISTKRLFCDKVCGAKWKTYSIITLTEPDEWKLCLMDGCSVLFPRWKALGRAHMLRACCCPAHSNIYSAKKRGASLKGAFTAGNSLPNKERSINRSRHCFRQEPFGKVQCRRYRLCSFEHCTGFEV